MSGTLENVAVNTSSALLDQIIWPHFTSAIFQTLEIVPPTCIGIYSYLKILFVTRGLMWECLCCVQRHCSVSSKAQNIPLQQRVTLPKMSAMLKSRSLVTNYLKMYFNKTSIYLVFCHKEKLIGEDEFRVRKQHSLLESVTKVLPKEMQGKWRLSNKNLWGNN